MLYTLGNLAVFILALFNAFVHSRDAWTSVVPTGPTLLIVAVVVTVINAVLGRMVQRRHSKVIACVICSRVSPDTCSSSGH